MEGGEGGPSYSTYIQYMYRSDLQIYLILIGIRILLSYLYFTNPKNKNKKVNNFSSKAEFFEQLYTKIKQSYS